MTEIDYKKIGLKIKKHRKKLNLTQVELGNMIRKTESSIRKYEKGIIKIPTDVLEELSNIFNISVFELISQEKKDETEINYMKIGLLIRENRKRLKMTQKELSEKIGKAEITVRKYEKGLVQIPNDVLEKLSEYINISVFNLISTNKIKFNYIKNIDIKDTDIKINAEDYEEYIKFKEISEIVLNMKKLSENKKLEIERYLKKAYLLSKNYNLEE